MHEAVHFVADHRGNIDLAGIPQRSVASLDRLGGVLRRKDAPYYLQNEKPDFATFHDEAYRQGNVR